MEKLKNKPLIITFAFVLIILTIILLINILNSTSYKLKKIGYSKEEIKELMELNIRIDDILKLEYNKDILGIIKEKYYIDDNFKEYINLKKDNNDKSYNEIISLVNSKAYLGFYNKEYESDLELRNLILVNKFYGLNKEYEPDDLVNISNVHCFGSWKMRKEAYDAFIKMYNDAYDNGYRLIINQAYRSYEDQEETYKENDDNYAAKPGHSEHQTGLALDIITYEDDGYTAVSGSEFHNTKTYEWLINNSYKYGFILRYPKDKEFITGYNYESWHFRYVGIDIATKVYQENITYDEYYAYYIKKSTN